MCALVLRACLCCAPCQVCPAATFQPSTGASSCSTCPVGLFLQSTAADATSDDCRACPRGAQCSGATLQSQTDTYVAFTPDGEVFTFACPSGFCTPCSGASSANNLTVTAGSAAGLEPAFPSVQVTTCCARHRMPGSALCAECESGYIDWGGKCLRCTGWNVPLAVGVVACSFLLVLVLRITSVDASKETGTVPVLSVAGDTAEASAKQATAG